MMKKSTLQHLRIPFSFFLMPVFLFALSQAQYINVFNTIVAFIVIHLFLYPASNGYNSYFDKDEESIGGLEKPLPVDKNLYSWALIFELVAILLSFLIRWEFAVMVYVYGLISRAYSHPKIRLKKYPVLSWLTIGIFQGGWTYTMCLLAISDLSFEKLPYIFILLPALLATNLLLGSYPLTQVYQHHEDAKRGDFTLSILLGVKGTFYFSALVFLFANVNFCIYFYFLKDVTAILVFQACLFPIFGVFGIWFWKVLKDEKNANFKNTMSLNKISSVCMIVCFVSLFFLNYLKGIIAIGF
jgi:4-hydroxybenzoate polyprenyltransferase